MTRLLQKRPLAPMWEGPPTTRSVSERSRVLCIRMPPASPPESRGEIAHKPGNKPRGIVRGLPGTHEWRPPDLRPARREVWPRVFISRSADASFFIPKPCRIVILESFRRFPHHSRGEPEAYVYLVKSIAGKARTSFIGSVVGADGPYTSPRKWKQFVCFGRGFAPIAVEASIPIMRTANIVASYKRLPQRNHSIDCAVLGTSKNILAF
ncbi:hypothetical protein FB451DRAFT_1378896 [Mycena latifolia]|nr:hypothetical protein FB451DRAFT_1378896 [Mycena latifolia]